MDNIKKGSVGRRVKGGGKIYPFNGIWPKLHDTVFIAPGARVIGDVEIGAGSSIWFNCVLRADVNYIRIGRNSNIQDGSIIHVDSGNSSDFVGHPTLIGDDVLIGHMAMVHGTTIENGGFIGLGAITMDGCHVEEDGMLAAGSLLSPKKRIKQGELWMGRPAKIARELSKDAIENMRNGARHYATLASKFNDEYN